MKDKAIWIFNAVACVVECIGGMHEDIAWWNIYSTLEKPMQLFRQRDMWQEKYSTHNHLTIVSKLIYKRKRVSNIQ